LLWLGTDGIATSIDSGDKDMSAWKLSRRHSLAAAIVTPFLALLSAHTEAAEDAAIQPAIAVAEEKTPDVQPSPEGLRAEGAMRELEERAAAVERKLRELGDGHPDQAEALKRELNGIRERMQQWRKQEGAERPPRLEGAVRELQERISANERALRELGDGQAKRAETLKLELIQMREKLQQLRRQAVASERERTAGALRELQERAGVIERTLQELGDRHPDRAEALERELKGLRERMQQVRQREGALERESPEAAVRELRERAGALERELQELGTNHPDRAEAIKRELAGIRERAQQLQGEGRRPAPQPTEARVSGEERPAVARELDELRAQMREMRQEMEALRADVRKLLERETREKR
jgi:DNA repair exonuclease SbcCD ATPase subunit